MINAPVPTLQIMLRQQQYLFRFRNTFYLVEIAKEVALLKYGRFVRNKNSGIKRDTNSSRAAESPMCLEPATQILFVFILHPLAWPKMLFTVQCLSTNSVLEEPRWCHLPPVAVSLWRGI